MAQHNTGRKQSRKASVSSVKTVEYQLRSSDDDMDSYEKGSRVYFYIIGVFVVAMLAYAGYLIIGQGNPFAGGNVLEGAGQNGTDVSNMKVEPPPPALKTTQIKINSTPPGAAVAINGVLQEGQTPSDYQVVPGHWNTISLYKKGLKPKHKNIEIPETGEPPSVQLAMSALEVPREVIELYKAQNNKKKLKKDEVPLPTTKFSIVSEPPGATVFFDGEKIGLTPLEINDVAAGVEHHITLRKKEYEEHVSIAHAFTRRESQQIGPIKLVASAAKSASYVTHLNIRSKGANIRFDGKPVGQGPYFTPSKRNQIIRVGMTLPEYNPYQRVLTTTVGSMEIASELQKIYRAPGTLSIKLTPKGVTAYLNSTEYRPEELKKLELPSGEYEFVVVDAEGNGRAETKLVVEPDQKTSYIIEYASGALNVRQK